MERSPRPTAIQPYGRACMNCSKSKCKCVSRPDGQGCVRCHRLSKPCLPGTSVRRSAAQGNNPINRIAQLEGKLDGLISTLSARVTATQPGTDLSGQNASATTMGGFTPVAATVPVGHFPVSSPSHGQTPDLTAADLPTDVEEYLGTFSNRWLKYFPFMHLPNGLDWMKQERPFLLLCICAVSAKSTPTRLALGNRIKQTVAERLVLDSHDIVNVDLLLGLLTFLAWGHDMHKGGTSISLSRFTQLAMMVVFELRLNKPPTHETNMISINNDTVEPPNSGGPEHTLEERRAVLGCFYMPSVISSYLGQIDALQWTPYMEETLAILGRGTDCPTDESFAHQIRLQLLSREVESVRSLAMPPYFYLKAIQAKLDVIKSSIPPHLQDDVILLDAIYYTELTILEPGLSLSQETPTPQQVEVLYTCLQTLKSATENFLTLPATEYPALPFPHFVRLARYIKVLVTLSTLNDPTWDINLARQTVDVLRFVDQIIINIQVAADGVDGPLAKAARVLAAIRTWCGEKLAESPGSGDTGAMHREGLGLDDMWTWGMFDAAAFEGLEGFS